MSSEKRLCFYTFYQLGKLTLLKRKLLSIEIDLNKEASEEGVTRFRYFRGWDFLVFCCYFYGIFFYIFLHEALGWRFSEYRKLPKLFAIWMKLKKINFVLLQNIKIVRTNLSTMNELTWDLINIIFSYRDNDLRNLIFMVGDNFFYSCRSRFMNFCAFKLYSNDGAWILIV